MALTNENLQQIEAHLLQKYNLLDFVDHLNHKKVHRQGIQLPNDINIAWEDTDGNTSSFITQTDANHLALTVKTTDKFILFRASDELTYALFSTADNYFGARRGYSLRAYHTDNTDYVEVKHDGTDAIITTNAGNINIPENVHVQNGGNLDVFDGTNTDYIRLDHDGSNAHLKTNAGSLILTPQGGGSSVWIYGGAEFGVYDSTNNDRTFLSHDGTDGTIGTDAGDLYINPNGIVKFGTHAAIGAETVTGYITIKDSGGTSRKIAVVS